MGKERELIDALRNAVNSSPTYAIPCTVININADLTCDCAPIDGSANILNVKVNADNKNGFVLKPVQNSVVMVTLTSESTGFVSMVSDIDSIQLNSDNLGGLVKIDNLKLQYDANIAAIKAACVAAFTALSGLDSGASLAAFNSAATSILDLDKTALENTKVKHGDI